MIAGMLPCCYVSTTIYTILKHCRRQHIQCEIWGSRSLASCSCRLISWKSMKALFIIYIVTAVRITSPQQKTVQEFSIQPVADPKPQRNGQEDADLQAVWQLCRLMNEYNRVFCLLYIDYGCFCGPGGTGSHPLDPADACCMRHDQCYDSFKLFCQTFSYITTYSYTCSKSTHQCTCKDHPVERLCRRLLCECDLTLAKCLSTTRRDARLKRWFFKRCIKDYQGCVEEVGTKRRCCSETFSCLCGFIICTCRPDRSSS